MSFAEHDPRLHVEKIKHLLNDVARHAREDMMLVSDPKAQALFETTAEGLQGLAKAFDDYEEKREKAWKRLELNKSEFLQIVHRSSRIKRS